MMCEYWWYFFRWKILRMNAQEEKTNGYNPTSFAQRLNPVLLFYLYMNVYAKAVYKQLSSDDGDVLRWRKQIPPFLNVLDITSLFDLHFIVTMLLFHVCKDILWVEFQAFSSAYNDGAVALFCTKIPVMQLYLCIPSQRAHGALLSFSCGFMLLYGFAALWPLRPHNGSAILEPLCSTQSNLWILLKVCVAHVILFMKQQNLF